MCKILHAQASYFLKNEGNNKVTGIKEQPQNRHFSLIRHNQKNCSGMTRGHKELVLAKLSFTKLKEKKKSTDKSMLSAAESFLPQCLQGLKSDCFTNSLEYLLSQSSSELWIQYLCFGRLSWNVHYARVKSCSAVGWCSASVSHDASITWYKNFVHVVHASSRIPKRETTAVFTVQCLQSHFKK